MQVELGTNRGKYNKIANMQNPLERNRKISAAYARIYQSDPNIKWAGLGAIVSRQAGCGIEQANRVSKDADQQIEQEMQNPEFQGDILQGGRGVSAEHASKALADANQLIYRTVSPTMSFVQQYGAKQLQSCLKSGDIATAVRLHDNVPNDKVDNMSVHPQLANAVDLMAKGTPDDDQRAADQIADYEQRSVVQDRIYSDPATKAVFLSDQLAAKSAIGRSLGAQAPEIPLSAGCTPKGKIPFSGWITDPSDRVAYYHKLSNTFEANGPAWQQSTMQQIIQQGSH